MRKDTKNQIDSDYNRIKPYFNENEELKSMCRNCESWCGKEHDYEECLDKPCFTFYRCYEFLDYQNTWR